MSYFAYIEDFRRWLNRAQTALVSKNKVRKDLWTDLTEILTFDRSDEDDIQITKTNYTSLATFLQTEGRSDSLSNDSILNWVNTLHELRQLLNEETRHIRQRTRAMDLLGEASLRGDQKEFERQMKLVQKYLTPKKKSLEEEEEKPPQTQPPPQT